METVATRDRSLDAGLRWLLSLRLLAHITSIVRHNVPWVPNSSGVDSCYCLGVSPLNPGRQTEPRACLFETLQNP